MIGTMCICLIYLRVLGDWHNVYMLAAGDWQEPLECVQAFVCSREKGV